MPRPKNLMTVKALREALEGYDDEMLVAVWDGGSHSYGGRAVESLLTVDGVEEVSADEDRPGETAYVLLSGDCYLTPDKGFGEEE